MRITLDVSQAQYPGTGVGNYTLELARHLVSLNSSHEIKLFGMSWGNRQLLSDLFKDIQVKKIFLPIPNSATAWLFNQHQFFPIEFLAGQTELFHTSDWTHPKTLTPQKVTTIHDLTPIKFPEYHHPKVIKNTHTRLELIQNDNSKIITDSLATKKDLIKLYNIDSNRIKVIYLAASRDFINFRQLQRSEQIDQIRRVKKKYKLDQYLLSVGTSEPRKNIGRIIQAFDQVVKPQYSNLKLAIAGKYGWGEDERKVHNFVSVLGFVDQADLPALYAGSKALVYPSLYEGFGLPVLEAMTLGIPVVTSKRGSLAEVAGKSAVVVDPMDIKNIGNGIIEVLTNPKKWSRLGLAQSEKFSWQQTAKQTMEVYESILDK